MRLTRYTDFALRVLIYLARASGRTVGVGEIADAHSISANHLAKVVQGLARDGFVVAARGRGGGLRLAIPAETIKVGAVVRATEGDCPVLDCAGCVLAGGCRLTGLLAEAKRAFYQALDARSIADMAMPLGAQRAPR
jgi:Rrf2 family nitric oxide-sensitive transcriptional repressor